MKNIKKFFVLLAIILLLPLFSVNAEEEVTSTAEKEPVNIYVFRGETCGYCKKLLEWFETIEPKYGKYYNLVTYEVWNNQENNDFMQEVASFLGDNPTGVPYVIVGKYTYPNGFAADSLESDGKTMGDKLIERIMEIYNSDNRYDVMEAINNKPDYSLVVGIVAGIVLVGLGAVVVISRRQTDEEE